VKLWSGIHHVAQYPLGRGQGVRGHVESNKVTQFRVLVKIAFVLEEGGSAA
jgi:flavin-binding protein dodecin